VTRKLRAVIAHNAAFELKIAKGSYSPYVNAAILCCKRLTYRSLDFLEDKPHCIITKVTLTS